MRILQIMAGAEHGGAETFFVDLTMALHKAGVTQKLIMRPYPQTLETLKKAGLDCEGAKFGGLFDFSTRRQIERAIAEFKPDIVQTWMNRATKFMPHAKGHYIHIGWQAGYYNMKYYRNCDQIVVVTDDVRKGVIAANWPSDRLHVIPPMTREIGAVTPIKRSEFDTPENVPLLLNLARLHPVKGQDILLEALAKVPEAYLWIAGEGAERSNLEDLAYDLNIKNRVRFLGWRQDREALLQTADISVFPSNYESFGIVILDTWQQKKPLVVTSSQGPRAIVTDGQNGLMVPVGNVEALAAAMQRLIADKNLAQKIAQNGFETYQKHYSQQAVTKSYLELYQNLLHSRKNLQSAA